MKVAVIGAGIIGVTTAYELAADGHEVTVFERRGSVAAETSFANAGVVAPGYVTPWAAPGMPGKIASMLFSRDSPVRFQPMFAYWSSSAQSAGLAEMKYLLAGALKNSTMVAAGSAA